MIESLQTEAMSFLMCHHLRLSFRPVAYYRDKNTDGDGNTSNTSNQYLISMRQPIMNGWSQAIKAMLTEMACEWHGGSISGIGKEGQLTAKFVDFGVDPAGFCPTDCNRCGEDCFKRRRGQCWNPLLCWLTFHQRTIFQHDWLMCYVSWEPFDQPTFWWKLWMTRRV